MKLSLPTGWGAALGAAKYALLAAAAGFAIWVIFIRPEAALRRAATAETEAIVADTQTQAAKETIEILVDHRNVVTEIHRRTEETNADILSAPGAGQEVDPGLYDALVRSLCLQDGRRDPVCADMLHRDGGSVGVGS